MKYGVARILICDDSVFMRAMLKKILRGNGHRVVGEAGNGLEATELYGKLQPDVTTMDIAMPELDGLGALKVIRAMDRKARVIMVTAMGQRDFIDEAIQSGASGFLVKPFDDEQVGIVVNTLLRF